MASTAREVPTIRSRIHRVLFAHMMHTYCVIPDMRYTGFSAGSSVASPSIEHARSWCKRARGCRWRARTHKILTSGNIARLEVQVVVAGLGYLLDHGDSLTAGSRNAASSGSHCSPLRSQDADSHGQISHDDVEWVWREMRDAAV